jgi:hypothetical protein
LLPVIWLAHPMSAAVFLGLGAYILFAKQLPPRYHPFLLLACVAVIIATREYLGAHFDVRWASADPFFLNGTDQFVLFGQRYAVVAYMVLAILLSAFAMDATFNRRNLAGRAVPAELYLLSFLTVLWLPDFIPLPGYAAPLTMITVRLTAVCGVLACAWFAAVRPRAWQVVAVTALAAVYFGMIYRDTGRLSNAEDRVVELVSESHMQRMIFVAAPASYSGSRVGLGHLGDRACVARCFSVSNYEPGSQQFRVRATARNGIVAALATDSAAMQMGTYVVRAQDLPLLSIYQCGPAPTDFCSRRLAAGDRNGKGAY